MAITLKLKIRKSSSVNVETWRRTIRDIITRDGIETEKKTDLLLQTLSRVPLESLHDKRWLEEIVNFIQRKDDGSPILTPLSKQAEWMKLARRVNALDDTREGDFNLSPADVERIWRRLTDEKFVNANFPLAYQEFVLDFCEASGKRFAGDVDDEEVK